MKKKKIFFSLALLLILLLLCSSCGMLDFSDYMIDDTSIEEEEKEYALSEDSLQVVFIDVGQGDSILIQTPGGKNMLIDSGEKSEKQAVEQALEENHVDKIDVLLATHPHSDHIGCMAEIVADFEIGTIYMPKVVHDTKTYQKLLENIQEKGLSIKTAKAGVTIDLDSEVSIEMFSPISKEYDDLNNYSPVMRLTYRDVSFLFAGDAEKLVEEEILETGADLSADVLKIGHHGSSSSSSKKFIKAVSPDVAIISVGEGNSYNHPHKETLKTLEKADVSILRTDELGSIYAVTEGKTISFYYDSEE